MGKDQFKDWTKNWKLLDAFFDEAEQHIITKKLEGLKVRNIVYCSFENQFARSGGLAAATVRVLPALKQLPGIQRVALITPFYPYIIDENQLQPTGKTVSVPFDGKRVNVDILQNVSWHNNKEDKDARSVEEYYLKAEHFFEARNRLSDPYIYFKDRSRSNDEAIKRNALFYSKAAPLAAAALGLKKDVIFHLQEWQTALISLTAKIAMLDNQLESAGTAQTIHNPFDSYISHKDIKKIITKGPLNRYVHYCTEGHTAYQLGLQLVDTPISTVSKNFAIEFTSDLLHTRHFAPHLQKIFQHNRVFGVANGSFTDVLKKFETIDLQHPDIDTIKAVKQKNRKSLLKILAEYHPEGRFGTLTANDQPIHRLPQSVPILVMSGRLDPVQKGFDILLRAIEKFEPGEVKTILTPMPIRDSDLDYFYKIAYRKRGDVTVFPIRMEKGYHELQTGGTFGVMPSIYEPFGAAIEYMAMGTVTIARDTGGLKDQILDGESGFLFKENPKSIGWNYIQSFNQNTADVERRQGNPWVESMAEELYQTISKASAIYRNQPDTYYRMIAKGIAQAKSFKWTDSAAQYLEIFKCTGKGIKNGIKNNV